MNMQETAPQQKLPFNLGVGSSALAVRDEKALFYCGRDDDLIAARVRISRFFNKLLMTNGCFDLLHPGHVLAIEHASVVHTSVDGVRPNVLVAMNSDSSVRALKGAARPVWNELQRAFMLLRLRDVTTVVIFDTEAQLERLVERVKPHCLFKGADWADKKITGADRLPSGSSVYLTPLYDVPTTSETIARICHLEREAQVLRLSGSN